MFVKKHMAEGRRLILAVCDDELLGKKFDEKGKQLDISREFYGDERCSEAELAKLIGIAYIINAVGKKSVACCARAGLCDEKDTPKISNIPYFQAVLF
jgi:uncharacterized protein